MVSVAITRYNSVTTMNFKHRSVVLVILIGLSLPALGHITPEMDGVRLSLHVWATGLLNRDANTWTAMLHEDLTTSDGMNRDEYAETMGGRVGEIPVTEVVLQYAHFEHHQENDVRVEPVVVLQAAGIATTSLALTFRETDQGWRIIHISTDAPEPAELSDVDLPEQYPLYPVPVQLRDAATGLPVSARIHVHDRQERYWPPDGHQKNIPLGLREDVGGDVVIAGKTYAYVEPDFNVSLPEGKFTMEVLRGIEYEPWTAEFEVRAATITTLNISLQRWSDIRQEGWYSGDTHVHFLDPHTALREARGEDLHVINILATKLRELITNVEHFSGGPDPLSEPERIVYVNEETRHSFLGHTVLLNLKELVYPLAWGGKGNPGVPGGFDYPAMAMQADKAHAQGGFVSWAHFPYPGGEVAIDAALGKLDAVDLLTWGDAFADRADGRPGSARTWYGFLNCGFRLPVTAGTDKLWNNQVVGIPRTYVKVEGPFSYQSWLDAVQAGKTFVTTGPLLFFEAGGKTLGETISASRGKLVSVRAEVRSRLPVDRLEIVQGGKIVAVKENPGHRQKLVFETTIEVEKSSWIAARAHSSQILPYQTSWYVRRKGIPLMAHTSPIYVQAGDEPTRSSEDAAFFLEWVDEALRWVKTEAKVSQESQRQEMIDIFEKARQVYVAQME